MQLSRGACSNLLNNKLIIKKTLKTSIKLKLKVIRLVKEIPAKLKNEQQLACKSNRIFYRLADIG